MVSSATLCENHLDLNHQLLGIYLNLLVGRIHRYAKRKSTGSWTRTTTVRLSFATNPWIFQARPITTISVFLCSEHALVPINHDANG